MKKSFVIALLVLLGLTTYAQRARQPIARTLEGVVVDTTGGARWMGIVVESAGKKYVVAIANNSDNHVKDPQVVGEIGTIGTRVRVTYTGTEPWDSDMLALHATRVVRLGDKSQMLNSTGPKQVSRHHYENYFNHRFEYSISYPSDLLYPQGEAANGDGQKFLSRDGRASMLVYGQEDFQAQTLAQFYQEELRSKAHPTRVVTYKVLRDGWFVFSGSESSRIFYQKTLLRNGEFLTFSIEYDALQKGVYDPIAAAISISFK